MPGSSSSQQFDLFDNLDKISPHAFIQIVKKALI